jgi:hypothetical protein
MKALASNPRVKNPRARTLATKDYPLRVQQSVCSPVAKVSSSFILGVEPLRCCGKQFKTEYAMKQHKRDSPAHPETHASTKATGRSACSARSPDDNDPDNSDVCSLSSGTNRIN